MADSDDTQLLTDSEDAAWASKQRAVVESYLQNQGCDHAGVSLEPRWFLSPYLAIWAVRSKSNSDVVGWWAVSGDVPTDYMTAARDIRSTADVLAAFASRWLHSAEAMSRGEHIGIGKPEYVRELGPLLRTRAEMLQELADRIRAEESEG
ncbi:MAG: DUF4826 family protein [Pirellulales bacterium]